MKSTVLGYGRRYFGGLEQRPPRVFVLHAIELLKRLVFGRNELPQIKHPPLARNNPANEHDLDHVDKLDVLVLHILDTVFEFGQLRRFAPGLAFFSQEVSCVGVPDRNSGAAAQLASRGLVM